MVSDGVAKIGPSPPCRTLKPVPPQYGRYNRIEMFTARPIVWRFPVGS
jgi:hypothetical protein